MSRIRGKDTKPEMVVRSLLHRMGYRFRLHGKGLPGRPDIVLARHKTVVFVHGCFWHRHEGCALARMPKSRSEFWEPKLEGNKQRDARNMERLALAGWEVLTIWECQLSDAERLRATIRRFLDA